MSAHLQVQQLATQCNEQQYLIGYHEDLLITRKISNHKHCYLFIVKRI